ncbi:patatin-like phospholipase [mine drainage metagenome]|uniref:Patatin-like phospholipase n=1 Tax=mine drainage metagenome TaxID=410659 RepID=A0A1J5S139_9ZZZZ
MKRAITLAGGGPAVGLSLGALKRLKEADIHFDVWALSCIGAWLGIVYNQAEEGQEVETSEAFFRQIFRDDRTYSRFPIASVFAPDFFSEAQRVVSFILDPRSYQNLVLPDKIAEAAEVTLSLLSDPRKWNQADLNDWMLNQVLAVNPISRFMTSLMYLSKNNGLSRIYYPDSAFLRQLNFENLYKESKPFIYHNAYNLTKKRLELFANKPMKGYGRITPHSLCACSALPYIEEPTRLGDDMYCEGATIDTVNFEDMLRDHPDLDEVWVSRILDHDQVRTPDNLYDSLNNLVMLFAATTSEDDVKLFKFHAAEVGWKGRIIEIPVNHNITYDWTHSNLDRSIDDGYRATDLVLKKYQAQPEGKPPLRKLQPAQ